MWILWLIASREGRYFDWRGWEVSSSFRDLCRELEDPFKWTRTVRARRLQMTYWLLGVLIGFVEVARDEADTMRRAW